MARYTSSSQNHFIHECEVQWQDTNFSYNSLTLFHRVAKHCVVVLWATLVSNYVEILIYFNNYTQLPYRKVFSSTGWYGCHTAKF
ncbi:hypothetical protein [Brasilonema sp. UFV-L1]|uniref:hypothetical protein n=1 Tax=Brasilonema sp. UFV-L1 TaxID=2234130 RepID=UPI0030D6D38E